MLRKLKLEHPGLIGGLLVLAVLAVYLPAGNLGFTNFDDPDYVTENPHIQTGLTWSGVEWAFTRFHSGNWHPLTWMSHMLDCQCYGLAPAGHHLTNVAFHAANAVLLFYLLLSFSGAVWRSAAVAALFAVHPLHVESVAWVAERKDVLSTFFGLLCLWSYLSYAKRARSQPLSQQPPPPPTAARWFFVLAWALFLCSLMSKPMLVTLPAVMLLLDFWPLGRVRLSDHRSLSRLAVEKIPFLVLSVASSLVTFRAQRAGGAVAGLEQISFAARAANALLSYAGYLAKVLWPSHLAATYPYPRQLPWVGVIAAAVLLTAITALAWWQRRARPYLLVGWLFYLGTLVPVIGLVQVGNQSMADRYTYVPSIGLLVMLAWGCAEWVGTSRTRRRLAAVAAAAGLAGCALVSQAQLLYWCNGETLARRALAVTSGNFVAWSNLGFQLGKHKELRQAEHCFRAALAINPNSQYAWHGLGSVLLDCGRLDEAVTDCATALRLAPTLAEAHNTLALALLKQGKTTEALQHYRECIHLRPSYAPAHYNLANALARLGDLGNAREEYQQSLSCDPTSADAHNNLAYILSREGKLMEAVAEFRAALALRPGFWQAHYGLGDVSAKLGDYRAAAEQFQAVLQIQPENVAARHQLAQLQSRLGNRGAN